MTNRARRQHKLGRLLLAAERSIVIHYLRKFDGNRTKAAKALGVHVRHLVRRIKALDIGEAASDPDIEISVKVDD